MTRTEQQRAESFRVLCTLLEQGIEVRLRRRYADGPMIEAEIRPPFTAIYWLDGGSLDACLAQLAP